MLVPYKNINSFLYEEEGKTGSGKAEVVDEEIQEEEGKTETSTSEEKENTIIESITDETTPEEDEAFLEKQIEAMKKSEDKPEETDKEIIEEKPEETKEVTDEPEKSEGEQAVKPEGTETDKTEEGMVTVNDEYIKQQPENVQKILNSIKGKRKEFTADAKLLKNHVNAEIHIEQLKSTKEPQQDKSETTERIIKESQNSPSTFTKEEQDVLENSIRHELELEYPELKGVEDIDDFLNDLNQNSRREAKRFEDLEQSIRSKYKQTMSQYKYIVQNHPTIIKGQVSEAFDQAEKEINSLFGLTNAKELLSGENYNFTQLNEKLQNNILDKLIRDERGYIDPNVVEIIGKGEAATYLYKPHNLAQKFVRMITPDIAKKIREEGETIGYEKGRSKAKEFQPNPSMSSSNIRPAKERKTEVLEVTDDMSPEEADVIIQKLQDKLKKT